jgi:glyoxylase-like metal-dependent hydrolase (beta-lactamase superfamily II)
MIRYHALHPATFKLDGGAMFGIIPKPLWEKQIPADDLNRIHLSLRVLCIQTDTRVILVDSGIGDYHDLKFKQRFAVEGGAQPLLQVLNEGLGLSPDDVTDVVVTHLHFDHVGGLGNTGGEFLFPRARLHVHRAHFNYALAPTVRDSGSFQTEYFLEVIRRLDVQGRVVWHEGEAGTLLQEGDYQLRYRCSHGHTPWLLHPYDDKYIYMADLVPTAAHVPLAWVMGYDIAPGRTTVDKADFYAFIRAKSLTMVFEHDIKAWGARLGAKDQVGELLPSSGAACEALP